MNILPARSFSQSRAEYSANAYSIATFPRNSSVAGPCSQVRSAATRKRSAGVKLNTRSNPSASNEPFLSPLPLLVSVICFSNSRLP